MYITPMPTPEATPKRKETPGGAGDWGALRARLVRTTAQNGSASRARLKRQVPVTPLACTYMYVYIYIYIHIFSLSLSPYIYIYIFQRRPGTLRTILLIVLVGT